MAKLEDANPPEHRIAMELGLLPGDIVFSEIPFADARNDDFTHFNNLSPGHVCVWINGQSMKGFVRSHQEGYQSPGLTFTGLWPGRYAVFRYIADALIPNQLAIIMKNWASLHAEEVEQSVLSGKAAGPHLSAANDLLELVKNQKLASLGDDGIRRAILFAARRDVMGEPEQSTSQRCTALVAAAFQASILAAIVKHYDPEVACKLDNRSLLLDFADLMLEKSWREHPVGEKLLKAANSNDYSMLFPEPFAVDQRYATPKSIYEKLQKAPEFTLVGHFSYFNCQLIAIKKPVKP